MCVPPAAGNTMIDDNHEAIAAGHLVSALVNMTRARRSLRRSRTLTQNVVRELIEVEKAVENLLDQLRVVDEPQLFDHVG